VAAEQKGVIMIDLLRCRFTTGSSSLKLSFFAGFNAGLN